MPFAKFGKLNFENDEVEVPVFFKNNSVSIDIIVEPFIEEVLKAEVKVRNLNTGYSIKLFPRDVSVTLRLSKGQHRLLKTNFLRLEI